MVRYRLGVDIGGTFTDFALIDDVSGKVSVNKALTTPHDPSEAIVKGTKALLDREGLSASQTLISSCRAQPSPPTPSSKEKGQRPG